MRLLRPQPSPRNSQQNGCTMLNEILPRQFDNNYTGAKSALWLLAIFSAIKAFQGASVAGLNPWADSRFILKTADAVPLDAWPEAAADHLVFLFAVWGVCSLLLSILAILAIIRYRAMVPLAYLLFLAEQLGRKTLSSIHLDSPFFAASGASIINWGFLAAIMIGLILSLRAERPEPSEPH